ncbi:MFS transporter, partial [Streptomyces goshikiensis]
RAVASRAAAAPCMPPAAGRGRYQGAFGWTWGVARFCALTLGVTLYTGAGAAALWWTALVAGVLSAAATLALRTRVAARTDHDLAA